MVDPQPNNKEIGDALEIELMNERVLPDVVPDGLEAKHMPQQESEPDFLIKDKGTIELVIECKNWDTEIPTKSQFENLILKRFSKYNDDHHLRVLVGHVNFTNDQRKRLIQNRIYYYELDHQVLPSCDEAIKKEFVVKLKACVALAILSQTSKYRSDCVSPMKVVILGGQEVLFKIDNYTKSINLKTKDVWFTRNGAIVSNVRKTGPKPLDIAWTIKSVNQAGSQNSIFIPRQYVIESDISYFDENKHQEEPSENDFFLRTFFKRISWQVERL